jgi:hypothetical protein
MTAPTPLTAERTPEQEAVLDAIRAALDAIRAYGDARADVAYGRATRKAIADAWDRMLDALAILRLATLDAAAPLDVERLIAALRPVTRSLTSGDHEKWLRKTAEAIAREYAALEKDR